MYIESVIRMIRYDEEVVGVEIHNGTEVNQVAVLCEICKDGMVCDEPGLNYSQIVPQKGWMPMLHTEPQTLEMVECINPGL